MSSQDCFSCFRIVTKASGKITGRNAVSFAENGMQNLSKTYWSIIETLLLTLILSC